MVRGTSLKSELDGPGPEYFPSRSPSSCPCSSSRYHVQVCVRNLVRIFDIFLSYCGISRILVARPCPPNSIIQGRCIQGGFRIWHAIQKLLKLYKLGTFLKKKIGASKIKFTLLLDLAKTFHLKLNTTVIRINCVRLKARLIVISKLNHIDNYNRVQENYKFEACTPACPGHSLLRFFKYNF